MHPSLRIVVPHDPVDNDLDLVLGEEAVRTEARLCLRRTGREHEEGREADDEGK